jgi:hypothetical protein
MMAFFDRGIGFCKKVSPSQRKSMSKEDYVGMVNMVAMSNVHRDEDPLSFLKNSSSGTGNGAKLDSEPTIAARKRYAPRA